MPVALFGITNDALNLVVNLLILFLVVLWLALVAWTYFDARRRLQDGFLVVCATACSLIFPFVGTIVYSILRPPEFLADQRERELEIRAAELRVRQLEEQSCPNCEHPVERTFLRCPNCRARIKDPCETCGKPIDPRWSIGPDCETPVQRAAPPEPRPPPKRRG
ncbi:MAG: double zinc ribbon domain-containing protein, partial [Candidatus Limnocylindria bacterium]